jgi:hypothetical protein
MSLQHLTAAAERCSAAPHTPKGVVVQQMHRFTCSTLASPQVQQVQQTKNGDRTSRLDAFAGASYFFLPRDRTTVGRRGVMLSETETRDFMVDFLAWRRLDSKCC